MNTRTFFFPYNEILPCHKAHDTFLFNECEALAQLGIDVTLLCGRSRQDVESIEQHYLGKEASFQLKRLPLIRKNNPLGLTWNAPFNRGIQSEIERGRPSCVVLSTLKQGIYHLRKKVTGITYLYEVHQLTTYPTTTRSPDFERERQMLARADGIITTTEALKEVLHAPPYNLSVPIAVIPLGVQDKPLPYKEAPFNLTYIGQFYRGQGVEVLLEAAQGYPLHLIGGMPHEVEALQQRYPAARFSGFQKPSEIPYLIDETTAFVAPFELTGRMPYVAHTKLYEYGAYRRPIIAPNTPVVREHLPRGTILYENGELRKAILAMKKRHRELQREIDTLKLTSWEERAHSIVDFAHHLC